jgi:hypothetical protein
MPRVKPTPEMEEEAEEVRQEVEGAGGAEGSPDAADPGAGGEEGTEEEEKEVSFDELGLDEQLKRALRKKGIAKATPIQQEAIPLILVRDLWLLLSFCCGCLLFRANLVQMFVICNPIDYKSRVCNYYCSVGILEFGKK